MALNERTKGPNASLACRAEQRVIRGISDYRSSFVKRETHLHSCRVWRISMFSRFVKLGCVSFLFGTAVSAWTQEPTTTTAQATVINPQTDTSSSAAPVLVTFTPIKKGIGPTPDATFGCSIPVPSVTVTYSNNSASWSGGISCSTIVGLYGTTVFFVYNTSQIDGYGNQINTNAYSANSSGTYYGLSRGTTYQVNFNVDITPPAGYTTNPGTGCSYISGGPRVHCTVGSGPISY